MENIFTIQKINKGLVGKMCKTSTTNQFFNGQEILIGNSHNKGNLNGQLAYKRVLSLIKIGKMKITTRRYDYTSIRNG